MLKFIQKIFVNLVILGFVTGVATFLYLYQSLDSQVEEIVNYKPEVATQVFDSEDRLIGNLFEDKYRIYASYNEIPGRVIEALVAVEDTMFFEHHGINLDAILRAMIKNIKAGKYVEGGSTLTQQLIKNVVLSREKSLMRKLKEAILALRVENELSKNQIIERYLNETFFGHGFYGVATAAKGYFNKTLDRLTLKEVAILTALPRAPSFYDPTRNLASSLNRANLILFRMKDLGWITEKQYEEGVKEVPNIYDSTLTQNRAPFVMDELVREYQEDIPDIKTGGYKIYLNIDLDYQEVAQNAIKFGYDRILKLKNYTGKTEEEKEYMEKLNGAMVIVDPQTGALKALVGGINYTESNFNRATQAKRQIGSSIKAFIYLSALNMGWTPYSLIPDITRIYETDNETKIYKPKNYTDRYRGLMTLKNALTNSVNLATINLVETIGFQNALAALDKLGFKNLPPNLSIFLGSFSLSPIELSQKFTIFSHGGTEITPTLINKVVDRNGKVTRYVPSTIERTTPDQIFLMLTMLKNVVEHGSGRYAKMEDMEIAGKTGTTNDNIDNWFNAITPDLNVTVWYGRDDNKELDKHFTGGVTAAPVAKYVLKRILQINPGLRRKFDKPDGVIEQRIDGEKRYYTNISKPDANKSSSKVQSEHLVF